MVTDANASATSGTLPEVIQPPTRRSRRAVQPSTEQAVPFTRRQMRERAAQLAADSSSVPSDEPTPPSAQHRQRHGTPAAEQRVSVATPAGPTRRGRRAERNVATPAMGVPVVSDPVGGPAHLVPSLGADGGPLTRAEARIRARAMAAAAAALEDDERSAAVAPATPPVEPQAAAPQVAAPSPAAPQVAPSQVAASRPAAPHVAAPMTEQGGEVVASAAAPTAPDRPLTRRELRERARALGVETSALEAVPEAVQSPAPQAVQEAPPQRIAEHEPQAVQESAPEPAAPVVTAPAEPLLTRKELRARKIAETGAIPRVSEPIVEPPPGTGAIRAVDETGQLQPIRPVEQTGPVTELPIAGHLQRPATASMGRLPRQPELPEHPRNQRRKAAVPQASAPQASAQQDSARQNSSPQDSGQQRAAEPRTAENLAAQWAALAADSGPHQTVRPSAEPVAAQPPVELAPEWSAQQPVPERPAAEPAPEWPHTDQQRFGQQGGHQPSAGQPVWSQSFESETDAEPIPLDAPVASQDIAVEPPVAEFGRLPVEHPDVAPEPVRPHSDHSPRAFEPAPPVVDPAPPVAEPVAQAPVSQPARNVAPPSRPTPVIEESHIFDKPQASGASRFTAPTTGQTPVLSPVFDEEDSSGPITLATGSIPVVRAPIVSEPTPVLDRFLQGDEPEPVAHDDEDADEHKGLNLLHWAIVVACALILGLVLWKGDFDSNGAPALEAPATYAAAAQNSPPAE